MKKFIVYHNKNLGNLMRENPNLKFPENYTKIAVVEADNLDMVFQLTNHIHNHWQENPECIMVTERARSTSVGDVIQDFSENRFWLVAPIGWVEMQGVKI